MPKMTPAPSLIDLEAAYQSARKQLAHHNQQIQEAQSHYADVYRGLIPPHPGPSPDERGIFHDTAPRMGTPQEMVIHQAEAALNRLKADRPAFEAKVTAAKERLDQAKQLAVLDMSYEHLDVVLGGLETAVGLEILTGKSMKYQTGRAACADLLRYLQHVREKAQGQAAAD